VDLPLHKEPRAGCAGLPSVLDDRVNDNRNRLLDVSVGEDYVGRLAAELQRDGDNVVGGSFAHELADLQRTREREVVYAVMGGEGGPGLFSETRDDIQGSGGKPRFQRYLAEPDGGKRGFLGRLQHAAVARGQGRGDGAAADLDGVVPRDDVCRDSERLAKRIREHALQRRYGITVE
jgi:hypothetical protein